jgi:Family of unknown function (DUF5522)
MPEETPRAPLVEDQDYYMDGPYLVFTREYHLRRGYCCQSGCRHCPWGFKKEKALAAESSQGAE